jgi:hypothetical protein
MLTDSSGYLPIADSPDSMMQSVPSRMALATSVASARVGRRLTVMDSSIWVAVITGLPTRLAVAINCFCTTAISSIGHFDAQVAAGDHDPVRTARISSMFVNAPERSIFATRNGFLPTAARRPARPRCPPRPRQTID